MIGRNNAQIKKQKPQRGVCFCYTNYLLDDGALVVVLVVTADSIMFWLLIVPGIPVIVGVVLSMDVLSIIVPAPNVLMVPADPIVVSIVDDDGDRSEKSDVVLFGVGLMAQVKAKITKTAIARLQ